MRIEVRERFKYVLIIGGIFLLALIFLSIKSSSPSVPSIQVNYGEFVVNLIESGDIEAVNSISVTAPRVRGTLQIIKLVKDGTYVRKGDLLVQFNRQEMEQEILKTLSDLKIAESEIKRKLANIESQNKANQIELLQAMIEYEEAKIETKKADVIPPIEAEKNELKYELAKKKYEVIQKKVEIQNKATQEELKILNEKKAKSEADYNISRIALQNLNLVASKDGLVFLGQIWKGNGMFRVQEGDNVWPGYPILELPDFSEMQVKTYINEVDMDKVKKGQRVIIHLDAFPEFELYGSIKAVASIGTRKNIDSRIKTFETIIKLDKTDPKMKPGMTCSVEIIIEKIPNAIFVPIESVFEKERKAIVYLRSSKTYRACEVELGKRSYTHVIVTKGLSRKDRIALRDPFSGPLHEEEEKSKGNIKLW